MKAYLLVFGADFGTKTEVKRWLDAYSGISDWRTELGSSFFIKSELSASQLTMAVRRSFKDGGFIIAEITQNTDGYLGDGGWEFLGLE